MLTRRTPLKPTGRDTGPNGATRIAVVMRDESQCVRCGVWINGWDEYSIHHRVPRGRGGTNRLANLILLCGSATTGCHGAVESRRIEALGNGWLLHTSENPAVMPVLCARRGLIMLDNNGEWRTA